MTTCNHVNHKIQYDIDNVQIRRCGDCGETIIAIEDNGITQPITTDEFLEMQKKSSVIVCAYCEHETPKNDKMELINHVLTCEKRPEKKLLEKAFEIEDRLFSQLDHVSKNGYHLEKCEICDDIHNSLVVWRKKDE